MREGTPEFAKAHSRWLDPPDNDGCEDCDCKDRLNPKLHCYCICHQTDEDLRAEYAERKYDSIREGDQ